MNGGRLYPSFTEGSSHGRHRHQVSLEPGPTPALAIQLVLGFEA